MGDSGDCIFCKIVAGDIPCSRVYEDDQVLAFLDIGPLASGHTLVIPKRHARLITELSADESAALFGQVPRLAQAVLASTGAEGLNVLQNNGGCSGQEVPHVHVHLIPRAPGDGLGYRWNAGSYDDGQQVEEIRQRIVEQL